MGSATGGYMRGRFLLIGFAAWLGASLLLRAAPPRVIGSGEPIRVFALYAASFVLMFFLLRMLVVKGVDADAAPRAAIALLLPTLILDGLASAFFPTVYPNFPASAAGVFGGWMLICCGGGLVA